MNHRSPRHERDAGDGAGGRRKTGPHAAKQGSAGPRGSAPIGGNSTGLPGVYHEFAGGVLIIRFRSPRFTLSEAEEIRDLVYGELDSVARFVLVNLSGVDYIDSTGVSLLVRMSNTKSLRIVNVSEQVAGVLRKMQILDLLYILPSELEARKSFFEP